eukprot:TRINITY_DN5739_c0_g1_i2.p1 TRINITY_DN5739_c0_g1~~TRINITY_DN5739_c0_g1_i2.p1  ORF type:complete len:981 (-),score=236.14 TRINITY_DN5739_c0_g1_i2:206-2971(-)
MTAPPALKKSISVSALAQQVGGPIGQAFSNPDVMRTSFPAAASPRALIAKHIVCDCFYRSELKTVKVMLSPFNTLGEALLLMHRKFLGSTSGDEKDSLLRNYGCTYFAAGAETMGPEAGTRLSNERLVSSIPGIADRNVTLELVHKPSKPKFVRVKTVGLQSSITLKIDDDTTVVQVILRLLKKIKDRNATAELIAKPYHYALFAADDSGEKCGKPLEEGAEILQALGSGKNSAVFAPCNELEAKDEKESTLQLKIINGYSYKSESVFFNPDLPVQVALEKVLKVNPGYDAADAGLWICNAEHQPGEFLAPCAPLSSYGITSSDSLEIKKRSRTFKVALPDDSTVSYNGDDKATVRDCYDFVCFNFSDVFGQDASKFSLFVFNGPYLSMERLLWSIPMPKEGLQLKASPQTVSIIFQGTERPLLLDTSATWKKLMPFVLDAVGLPKIKAKDYTLTRLKEGDELDIKETLVGQGITEGTAVVLEVSEKKLEALKREEEEETVNIWEEEENDTTVRFESGVSVPNCDLPPIEFATFNKLVERLTSFLAPDLQYMKAFLLTYRSFATPELLFQKLVERYHVPEREAKNRVTIQLRVCNTLKYWVENCAHDFDHDLAQQLMDFIDNTLMSNAQWRDSLARRLRSAVLQCAQQIKEEQETENAESLLSKSTVTASSSMKFDLLFEFPVEHLARQLTLYEFNIYQSIKPQELLNQCWSKPETEHQAPHVIRLIERFNLVSMWVVFLIVTPMRAKERVKRWAMLIKIAWCLWKPLNNFSMLMAFVSGFSHSAISRLKHTKALLPKTLVKQMAELDRVMSAESSFKAFRQELKNATPPAVPYIGVYLKDLTFIEDGNPDTTDGLINFAKRGLIYRIIEDVQQYQLKDYDIKQDLSIAPFVQVIHKYDENHLYKLSLEREPRGAEKADIL